ncbi:hypothetical protein GOODEAATRI_019699, partial [Goodea atripinnis]
YRGWVRGMQEGQGATTCHILSCFHPQPGSRANSKASCTTRAASPSPQRQSSTARKKRAMVVLLESWKSSLPPEQQEWLSRALFIKDRTGRAVLSKELQLWYHPPGPRLIYSQPPSSPDAFFQRQFFLWAPYRMLSCDKKVVSQMKGQTLSNSTNRLHSFLVENHTEEWMTRCLLYLETCGKFQVAGVHLAPTAHPSRMQPVPTSGWLLSTYARETFSRMEELQASVTSVFGSILKMDSTKKVIKKLAGADAGTAQWMSSVGNELGQVLICVVMAAEGYGLQDMAKGLQKRYEQAGRKQRCNRCSVRLVATAPGLTGHLALHPQAGSWSHCGEPPSVPGLHAAHLCLHL